jgi:hypothetical protein
VRKSSNFYEPIIQGPEEEIKFIDKASEKGVVYMIGEAEVVAHPNSSILNKIVVNYAYSFLRKNFRQGEDSIAIHHKQTTFLRNEFLCANRNTFGGGNIHYRRFHHLATTCFHFATTFRRRPTTYFFLHMGS